MQIADLPASLKRFVPRDFPPTQLVDATFLAQHPEIFAQVSLLSSR